VRFVKREPLNRILCAEAYTVYGPCAIISAAFLKERGFGRYCVALGLFICVCCVYGAEPAGRRRRRRAGTVFIEEIAHRPMKYACHSTYVHRNFLHRRLCVEARCLSTAVV
jgi:hypothetical protein